MKALAVFAFVVLLFAGVHTSVFAVSVTISSFPQTINQDPFTLTASVSGASTGTNYLRVDIYKDGSDNYFGETFNGSSWYGGSTYTQYLPVNIQSGAFWSGNITAKVGSPTVTEYDGLGAYKIRVRRYTESGGSNAAEASNSSVSVSVNIPTPTATPAPPTATPKLTPTSTPIQTPTQIVSKLSIPTLKPTVKISPKISQKVLGEKAEKLTPTREPTKEILLESQKSLGKDNNLIPKLFISVGIVFLLLCGIVISYPFIKKIKDKNINE